MARGAIIAGWPRSNKTTLFYLIFTLIGLRTHAEMTTNRGRIDAVVEVASAIYLFEFKLNGSAEEALTQIKTTAYYERYQRHGKPLWLVGVNLVHANGAWRSG